MEQKLFPNQKPHLFTDCLIPLHIVKVSIVKSNDDRYYFSIDKVTEYNRKEEYNRDYENKIIQSYLSSKSVEVCPSFELTTDDLGNFKSVSVLSLFNPRTHHYEPYFSIYDDWVHGNDVAILALLQYIKDFIIKSNSENSLEELSNLFDFQNNLLAKYGQIFYNYSRTIEENDTIGLSHCLTRET